MLQIKIVTLQKVIVTTLIVKGDKNNKIAIEMDSLPQDINMLFSFVNMKLRDEYDSLDAFCEDLNVDKEELIKKLSEGGFEYNESQKKFW